MKYNFHDATIKSIHLDWAQATVYVDLIVWDQKTKQLVSKKLKFLKFTKLTCPRLCDWGESSSINAFNERSSNHQKQFLIEIQSGDTIIIECNSMYEVDQSEA